MPSKELLDALRRDEGLRLKAYRCSAGVLTIGYGHTGPEVHEGLTWTQEQADRALEADAGAACKALAKALPWVADLDPVRLGVLQNMAFNLGVRGLLQFHNTLACVRQERWEDAAKGLLASLWARQVKGRAVRLAEEMRSGKAGG
jgi:lysozyme